MAACFAVNVVGQQLLQKQEHSPSLYKSINLLLTIMINIGRICVKTAGRDAGLRCVILSNVKNNRVLIDGETRRRTCNVGHLEPLPTLVQLKQEASHEEVAAALQPLGIVIRATKPKKTAPRQRTLRRSKLAKKTTPETAGKTA